MWDKRGMTLAEYLTHTKQNPSQFARSLGVSDETVRRYVAGRCIPRRQVMARIVEATKGKVTPGEFFRERVQ